MNRRDVLRRAGVAAAGTTALAGCTSPGGDGEDSPEHSGTEPVVGERDQTEGTPDVEETNTDKGQTETEAANEVSAPAEDERSQEGG